jgi:hypothetical protein
LPVDVDEIVLKVHDFMDEFGGFRKLEYTIDMKAENYDL